MPSSVVGLPTGLNRRAAGAAGVGVTPDFEGRIEVTLTRARGRPLGVEVRSTRPQVAQRLMAGREPREAAELAGLLFSLCGKAQRVAAEAACEAAQGLTPGSLTGADRERRVLIELAQEHARRLLLDWAQWGGGAALAPDAASLIALRQAAADPEPFADALDRLLATALLGKPADSWQAMDLVGFDAWCAQGGTLPARLFGVPGTGPDRDRVETSLLPPLERMDPAELAGLAARALNEPAFCVYPLWSDGPAETGALARVRYHALVSAWVAERGAGLRARMLARLVELAGLPRRLRADGFAVVRSVSPRERVGVAGVETSRGLLVHAVRMESDGRIGDYRIIAPTEWNCHPSGPLAAALASLDASVADLSGAARRVVESLDPCVGFDVEIRDA